MQKVLFVIGNLRHDSPSAQLMQLLRALPREQFSCRVCILGKAGSPADRLRELGIEVDAPGRGRLLDLRPLAHLRGRVRSFAPEVVHAWGLRALRGLALSGHKGRVVASPCLRPQSLRTWLRRLDGWLLRKVDRVVAFGKTEATRCRALGVDPQRMVTIAPAVRMDENDGTKTGVPEGNRFILCVGELERHKGFHDAIWAYDILRYVHPDLRLVIAGEGPDRERLERFSANAEVSECVWFPGEVQDVFALMRQAEVVWSPGQSETGREVVLEAMAAGKPVVASRFPGLAELVVEGETGLLVPAGDKPMLARATQQLLSDPGLRARMGEAGRRRVAEQHRPDLLAERCAALYKGG